MASSKQEFKTAIFEDGACAVLRADPTKPHLLEVIATFHDAERARDYVRFENNAGDKHQEERTVIKQISEAMPNQASQTKTTQASTAKPRQATKAKPEPAFKAELEAVATDVSERQQAVLNALRSLMDKKNLVEIRGAELAEASSIPAGSLHSVLVSIEKKGLIRTERQGSAKFRAIYEVLETPRKSTQSLNGVAHGEEELAKTSAR
jgi:uncharacterized membrane protein